MPGMAAYEIISFSLGEEVFFFVLNKSTSFSLTGPDFMFIHVVRKLPRCNAFSIIRLMAGNPN